MVAIAFSRFGTIISERKQSFSIRFRLAAALCASPPSTVGAKHPKVLHFAGLFGGLPHTGLRFVTTLCVDKSGARRNISVLDVQWNVSPETQNTSTR